MMFKALATLLVSAPTLILSVCREDAERLRVTITPHRPRKSDEDDETPDTTPDAFRRPLVVVGTLDELDVDLPSHLERWAQTRTSMAEVFADAQKELEEAQQALATAKKEADAAVAAEKERAKKGVPTITKPAPAAKPAAPASIL